MNEVRGEVREKVGLGWHPYVGYFACKTLNQGRARPGAPDDEETDASWRSLHDERKSVSLSDKAVAAFIWR